MISLAELFEKLHSANGKRRSQNSFGDESLNIYDHEFSFLELRITLERRSMDGWILHGDEALYLYAKDFENLISNISDLQIPFDVEFGRRSDKIWSLN